MKWERFCSRCNGSILKDEGKQVGRCRNDGTQFWEHKTKELCREKGLIPV